ncbi:hypothetical protein [Nocardioides sp. WS12]|uniref:hypothetical protein n=1 Tax=Nocardioides sp. WS12 TaxID=2486272 RepID=UPI0015FDAA11|nr:hypothetical protein [Nocardioides sp. WS12]
MARRRVKLNHRELEAILKSDDVRKELQDLAGEMKSFIEGEGIRVGDTDGGKHEYDLPVTIDSQTTDRAREVVGINHPAGMAVQAKHGVLTKAAAHVGLQVRSKS